MNLEEKQLEFANMMAMRLLTSKILWSPCLNSVIILKTTLYFLIMKCSKTPTCLASTLLHLLIVAHSLTSHKGAIYQLESTKRVIMDNNLRVAVNLELMHGRWCTILLGRVEWRIRLKIRQLAHPQQLLYHLVNRYQLFSHSNMIRSDLLIKCSKLLSHRRRAKQHAIISNKCKSTSFTIRTWYFSTNPSSDQDAKCNQDHSHSEVLKQDSQGSNIKR